MNWRPPAAVPTARRYDVRLWMMLSRVHATRIGTHATRTLRRFNSLRRYVMKASPLLRALAATLVATFALAGHAAEVLKVIVPTAPGGGTDGYFRVLAREVE